MLFYFIEFRRKPEDSKGSKAYPAPNPNASRRKIGFHFFLFRNSYYFNLSNFSPRPMQLKYRFFSILRHIALTLLISSFIPAAYAQTCRVSMGDSNGHQAYMEVYEYDYVSEKPSFPGGDCQLMEFINHTRKYPDKAYRRGIQGRVTCSFVVNANGSISHVTVLKSVEESLNREAVRILSLMPDWTPGRVDGRPVPVRVVRCIPFRR